MINRNILITTSTFGKVDEKPLRLLEEAGFNITLNPYGRTLNVSESLELMPGVSGMIAGTEKLNGEVLNAANELKYLCRLGAGMDNVDFDVAKKKSITVENTPSAHVKGVAELTLAGILSLLRRIHISDRDLKAGVWEKYMGGLLYGKKVGVVGFGRVARHLTKLLMPFEVEILAYDPYIDNKVSGEAVTFTTKEYLFQNADIISLHLPYSADNHHIINESAFSTMKDNVTLVNVARGGLIDEIALYDFLNKNIRASAYLDTFEQEPYKGKLTELDNILLSPHIGSYAREVRIEMEMMAAENLINFFKNYG